jgi:hypothetical protein
MAQTTVQVRVDGRAEEFLLPPSMPFPEVMKAVGTRAKQPGAGITRVRLNGEDITGQSWNTYLHLTAGELRGLEVETGDLSRLARETLGSLQDFIAGLLRELERTVEKFRLGDNVAAGESFTRALDGIQLVSHTTSLVEKHLEIDTRTLELDGRPVADQLKRIEPILEDMFTAQKNNDWVLLADLIEYELAPYFQDRLRIVRQWLDRAHD